MAVAMEGVTAYIDIRSVLICSVIFLCLSWYLRKPRNLPPGPWSVPILGSIPYLALAMYRSPMEAHKLFQVLASRYGSIFSLDILGYNVVVLNSYEAVKEAFQNPVLNDRPHIALIEEQGLQAGIIAASGESWKQQRKFTTSTLRGFGVGKNSFEDQITKETTVLLNEFKKLGPKEFDPRHLLSNAVANVICAVIFGHRYQYEDEEFQELLNILNKQVEVVGCASLQVFFPSLKYLQPKISKLVKENGCHLVEFVSKIINEHRSEHDPESPQDFIDAFLTEIGRSEGRQRHLNECTLIMTIQGLFTAGSETTATTLRWAVLYMIEYPELQRRIQEELDNVVGRERLPRLSDMPNLPFTEATLLEVQRNPTTSTLGVPHCAAADTNLRGYFIPKGAFLLSNLWAVHHDPDVWIEPSKFDPTRFLDSSGMLSLKPELIPFSSGRRICLGENLAKMELFLFFTHMMHQFTFTKPPDSSDVSIKEGIAGATYQAKPFRVVVNPRG